MLLQCKKVSAFQDVKPYASRLRAMGKVRFLKILRLAFHDVASEIRLEFISHDGEVTTMTTTDVAGLPMVQGPISEEDRLQETLFLSQHELRRF